MDLPADPRSSFASVIVPVFDGAGTLDACLKALSAQTIENDRYEVIVVDDGSTDGSAAVAAQYGVRIVHQDHAGAAAARNRGARQDRGQVLLFTDADCEPAPGWVEQMLAPFADPEVMGVKGVYRTRQRSVVARFTQAEFEEKYDRQKRVDQIDFVDTYAAAYRREVFATHGGFDPEFLLDEDQEFSFRLAAAGCKLVLNPVAVVYHQHPSAAWCYAWRKVQFGRWKVRVLARHPSKALYDSYTPWTQKAQIVLLPLAGGAVIAAALGLIAWTVALIPAAVGLLTAIPLLIKASRQGWQVVMLAPVLILIRALALGLGLAWGLGSHLKRPSDRGEGQLSATVFLDRDGVINENRDDYVKSWDEVRFIPGVFGALARLSSMPFRVVLITNQSPIGRGILAAEQVEAINRRLAAEIEAHGGRVAGVYYCPHHPDDGCACRKPKPGLLHQAAQDLGLDLTRSYLIGDAVSDVEAALAAGCKPILVLTGRGREQRPLLQQCGFDHISVVHDLAEAVALISAERKNR